MDDSKLSFFTGANYMKRLVAAQGSQVVTIPAFGTQTLNVSHNLGHIPGDYQVQVDYGNDGTIWTGNLPYVGMDNPSNTPPTVQMQSWSDINTLTIRLAWSNSGAKTVVVYWVVYMDYDV